MYEGYFINDPSKKCVIKTLKPVRLDKIRREISILKNLDHPNIIKLYDVVISPESNFPALIMEYVDTGDQARKELYGRLKHDDI